MFKGMGKKMADGAIEKFAQKVASIDLENFKIVSKHLTDEQAAEFHKNLALIVAYGVKKGAEKIAQQGG